MGLSNRWKVVRVHLNRLQKEKQTRAKNEDLIIIELRRRLHFIIVARELILMKDTQGRIKETEEDQITVEGDQEEAQGDQELLQGALQGLTDQEKTTEIMKMNPKLLI